MNKAYEVITDRIIDLLEKGTVPWHRSWGGKDSMPKSLVSGKQYRGINSFLLNAANYESPYWMTYKQAKDRGGSVRHGEKGYPCIYWNWIEKQDPKTKKTKNVPFLKYYTVFNATQCKDVEYPKTAPQKTEFEPIANCEKLVNNMPTPPEIAHEGVRASYSPAMDKVRTPSPESFDSPDNYYSVLFHELCHSTGHKRRLARKSLEDNTAFGSPTYSKEELVAEMGSAYLCGWGGIENQVIDNSAAYINHWLDKLHKDSSFIVQTASQAQKAADYVLGNHSYTGT